MIRPLALAALACLLAGADPQPWYRSRHDGFVRQVQAGGIDVLFLGDSITDFWRSTGKDEWQRVFAPLRAANLGIQSDRTQGLLWRLRNGELEGRPRVVVLLIGTNDGGTPADVAAGVRLILDEIRQRSPESRVLLLGLLPRGELADDRRRLRNDQANLLLAGFAKPVDPGRIAYLDIGARFLGADRAPDPALMPDRLHPSAAGYRIMAEAILGPVRDLLGQPPRR